MGYRPPRAWRLGSHAASSLERLLGELPGPSYLSVYNRFGCWCGGCWGWGTPMTYSGRTCGSSHCSRLAVWQVVSWTLLLWIIHLYLPLRKLSMSWSLIWKQVIWRSIEFKLIIFFAAKDEEALYSQQKQDWELTVAQIMNLIAKFRLKLKKVGKTTRPFRYDLNQILYDYTIGVRNRFQGIRSDGQSAWRTMDGGSWHCTGGSDQDHPQKKNCKKAK